MITLKVSNFDQTATKERTILHVRPPERLRQLPTPPAARLKEPKSKATCVHDHECVDCSGSFIAISISAEAFFLRPRTKCDSTLRLISSRAYAINISVRGPGSETRLLKLPRVYTRKGIRNVIHVHRGSDGPEYLYYL